MIGLNVNNTTVYVSISEDNIHIYDSHWLTSIKDMRLILETIRIITKDRPNNIIHKRSLFSMISEWRAHNLLYWFDYKIDRTGSVDLSYNNFIYNLGYFCLSLIYLKY